MLRLKAIRGSAQLYKGGVGKSLIAAVLAQYLRQTGLDVRCIDTDPVNRTFAQYSALKADRLCLRDEHNRIDQRSFDALMERFLSKDEATFVIDNEASTFLPLWHYLLENNALDHLRHHGRRVVVHTVVTGGQALMDTLNGFHELAQTTQDRNIVVWINEYFGRVEAEGKSSRTWPPTERRRSQGPETAVRCARMLIKQLLAESAGFEPRFLVAINEAKRRLETPEETYRTMLLDLIALVDAALAGRFVSSIDVVVATRTNCGVRMTTETDLERLFVTTLPVQFQSGLASRGLLERIGSDALQLHILSAARSWGLIVADFLCNTVYNRRHAPEHDLITELEGTGRLSVFEAIGSYSERRARVAERDGDWIGAIGRWSLQRRQPITHWTRFQELRKIPSPPVDGSPASWFRALESHTHSQWNS